MNWPEWYVLVTMAVAIYGAGLSTYSAVANARSRKPRLRVISDSLVFLKTNDWSSRGALIQVINIGEKAVVLEDYRLVLTNMPKSESPSRTGRFALPRYTELEADFPYKLEPGHQFKIVVPLSGIAWYSRTHGVSDEAVVQVEVEDQTGRMWCLDHDNLIRVRADDFDWTPFDDE